MERMGSPRRCEVGCAFRAISPCSSSSAGSTFEVMSRGAPRARLPVVRRVVAGRERRMGSGRTISMLEGNTFVVSDLAGDIAASPTDTLGMFAWDTRHLSRWVLTVNGQTLNPLSTGAIEYYATQFFLVPDLGTVYVDVDLSIVRK